MVKEGRPFRGVLYAGLILTAAGTKTIEFNARFGDPETQVILPRLETDLLDILLATVNGRLEEMDIRWSDEAAVCVILASDGYPGTYPKNLPITGLNDVEQSLIFHAGTALKEGQLVTNGGRVLGVVGRGRNIKEAREQAYRDAERIYFEGKQYRTDIAKKALV
jgi:phosphoribosylamine--glycine ligase